MVSIKKENKYIMFYAKQSLIVFYAYIISVIIATLPGIGIILGPIAYILTTTLWIFS